MRRRLALAAIVLVVAAGLAGAGVRHWRLRNVGPEQRGWAVASARGCFDCHGPGGATGLPDPEGRTGGVPGFGHEDVAARARSDDEIREWILDGSPRRLRNHPLASFFLRRQMVKMPAYRGRVSEEELGSLRAYVRWLRRSPAARAGASSSGEPGG